MTADPARLLPGVPLIESPLFATIVADGDFSQDERRIAADLNERGYAVIDFPDVAIDARMDRIRQTLAPRFGMTSPDDPRGCESNSRIQDAWIFDDDVRAIAANREILRLLGKLYGRRAFPFQTLNFPVGTQQHMHSDSIHFSSIPPRFMCGVWLAMEDIDADAGPLVYYPGTHAWPILSNDMLGLKGDDNPRESAQTPYEPIWRAMVREHDIAPDTFRARKGQALIWTANLLHGGLKRNNPALTRWSQVTHYYFEDCIYYTPAFSNEALGRLDLRAIVDVASGEIVPNRYLGEEVKPPRVKPARGRFPLWPRRKQEQVEDTLLPEDFDDARYYRLNRDVAQAQADAREHYLRHGRKEGRRYK